MNGKLAQELCEAKPKLAARETWLGEKALERLSNQLDKLSQVTTILENKLDPLRIPIPVGSEEAKDNSPMESQSKFFCRLEELTSYVGSITKRIVELEESLEG